MAVPYGGDMGQMGGRTWFGNPLTGNRAYMPTEGENISAQRNALEKLLAGNQLAFQSGQADKQRAYEGEQRSADRNAELTLGMAPINLKRDIFNQVSPLLTGLLGQNQGGGLVGGANTVQPSISRGPMFSDQQINQQVNAAKSGNAQMAETANQAAAKKTAGQGFGSRSPLLAALQGQTNAARMGADADAERDIRFGAAQKNADQTYRTDQLAEQQWNDLQDADIRRRQSNLNYTTSLAGILGGLL